jgi:hypothetical protein
MLSLKEKQALEELSKLAVKKSWLPEGSVLGRHGRTEIAAPIEKVANAIAKVMRPEHRIVSAVRFSDGTMQEITEAKFDDAAPIRPDAAPIRPDAAGPYRIPVLRTLEEPRPEPTPETEAEAGVAVARPSLGCPAPNFENADVKATRVLRAFLTPAQQDDWDRYNRFIAVGAVTGHRYMITSRHAQDSLAQFHRSLYDLEERTPYCVHEWSVPAAEEVLSLLVCLRLPNHEEYLRHLDT